MAKRTTRDAALSRLFGSANVEEGTQAGRASPGGEEMGRRPKTEPLRTKDTKRREHVGQGRGEAADTDQSPSGYIGLGRYTRSDGIVERITPYVRPDQAEALRLAVARKSDPRGTDISQIIQTLLDEAGYRA